MSNDVFLYLFSLNYELEDPVTMKVYNLLTWIEKREWYGELSLLLELLFTSTYFITSVRRFMPAIYPCWIYFVVGLSGLVSRQ